MGSHIEASQEYNTLRQELLEAKRYVFERPLAIAAVAAIGLQSFEKPQHIALPFALSLLTLFNYWFTVNRLQSAARIVAYINLVLEPTAQLIEAATVRALLFSVGTEALCIWSIRYFVQWRPKRLRAAIQRNRVIWLAALREQIANNAEATATGRR
jgi:hypothetical protein